MGTLVFLLFVFLASLQTSSGSTDAQDGIDPFCFSLLQLLFDGNNFTGTIPDSIGLVQTIQALNLANNRLTGMVPNLSGMKSLNYV
ncbi:hypothetical protein GW17_00006387 [Ensete ventricosum]|nr:hypothetical protein GW17_00006387 [Ensete ventricosum]